VGDSPLSAGAPPPLDPGSEVADAAALPKNFLVVLCYVFLVVAGMVALAIEPYRRDRDLRFHAWQSLLFVGLIFSVNVLGVVLRGLGLNLLFLLRLGLLAAYLLLILQAIRGVKVRLPLLGDWAEQLSSRE
jgi:uncharacterized membrane protein